MPAARRIGRPRSSDADRAILDATRAALVDLGWGRLTMGDVASRAGVAKTTLYRRWPSKNELVVDALAALFAELALPDLGSLRADLEGVVRQLGRLLSRPEARSALTAVIAESARDPALRLRVRKAIIDPQKRLVLLGRSRAQSRGELPPDSEGAPALNQQTDDLIFDVIAGSVVHRALISDTPIDQDWARRFSTFLLDGMAATLGETTQNRGGSA